MDITTTGSGGSGVYSYQWFSNGSLSNNGGVDLGNDQGANTNIYSIPATNISGNRFYYIEIRDVGCSQVISTNAFTVTTSEVLGVATQPQSQGVCNNNTANINVVPSGGTGTYTYQWFRNTQNSNIGGTNLGTGSGAQTATYTVPGTTVEGDRYYYVVVTDVSCGANIKSNAAKITTGTALMVGTQPLSQVICNNTSVGITTAGAGASLSYTYQWFANSSNSNIGGSSIIGATSATYIVPATTVSGDRFYYAVITDASCGLQISTNPVTVTTRLVFSVGTQPLSQSVCMQASVDLPVVGFGGSGNYSYQWYSSASNSNIGGVNLGTVSNANTATYTVPGNSISGNRFYYAVITDNVCTANVTTNAATIFTRTALAVGTQPQASQVIINNTGTTINTIGSGASGPYSYQWYEAPNNTNSGGSVIAGATSETYMVPPTLTAGSRYFYATITDLTCLSSINTVVAEVITTGALAIVTQPLSHSICNNTATTISVQTSGGTASYSYQWYRNTVNSVTGATLITGATAATYTVPASMLVTDRYYFVIITDINLSNTVTSDIAKIITLTGTPVVVITQPTANTTICVNGNITLQVTGFGGSSGSFVYQWYRNNSSSNSGGTAILGQTGATFTSSITQTGTYYYYATVADPACGSGISSNVAKVQVNAAPSVSVTPNAQVVCNDAQAIAAEASVTGGAGLITYQWYANSNNSVTGGVSLGVDNGARTVSFIPPSTNVGTVYYYVEASFAGNGCSVAVSNTHQLTVNKVSQPADIIISTPNTTLCKGLSTNLHAALSSSSNIQNPVFTWYSDANFTNLVSTGTDFTTPVLNNSVTYYVKVSGTNACDNLPGNGQSQTITVTAQAPEFVTQTNLAFCAGITTTPIVFTSTISGTTYSWSNDNAAIGLAASGNGNLPSFSGINNTLENVTSNISVTPYANGCTGVTKTFVIAIVPNAHVNDTSFAICTGGAVNFTPVNVPVGKKYSWVLISAETGISGAVANAIPQSSFSQTLINTTNVPKQALYLVTPDGCSDRSFTITVNVNPAPQINSQSMGSAICSETGFTYAGFAGVIPGGTLYTWETPLSNPAASVTNGTAQTQKQNAVTDNKLYNNLATVANALYVVTPYSPAEYGSCAGQPFTLTVPVNPKPVLTVTNAGSICNNTTAVFIPSSLTTGVTYSWIRPAIANISNIASSGVNGFSEKLINTGTFPVLVNYEYTLTANGCDNKQSVQVLVNPDPVLNSQKILSVCSGALFNYSPSSLTNGTSFAWSRQVVSGIKNTANAGTGDIFEALVNSTNTPVTVVYRFTLTANSCIHSEDISVTVNPIPSVSESVDQVLCNGSQVQVSFAGSLIPGTVYSWTNTNSNVGLTSSGNGNISFTAVNRLSLAQTAAITVVPVANGCSGTTKNFNIIVNPTPNLSSSVTPPAVCSNTIFTYIPESNTDNTNFSWSRAVVNGISNGSASGNGTIRETLINNSNIAVQVPYEITLAANGCSVKKLVIVTVNPIPSITKISNLVFCNNTIAVVNFSGSTISNTVYSWTNNNTDLGVASAGSGDMFFVASNKTASPVISNIKVTPESGGCKGLADSFSIKVSPSLVLKNSTSLSSICSNSLLDFKPEVDGDTTAVVSWARPSVYGISNKPASGKGSISEKLINTTASPVLVTYVLTISNKECTNTQNVTVSVTPAINITNASSGFTICSKEAFLFSPNTGVTGTQFKWTRDAVAGISNAADSAVGDISEILINTTSAPIDVLYRYNISGVAACSNDQIVKVTVNPLPQLVSAITLINCSNTPVAYLPASNITGTNFTWNRPTVNGIVNIAASGLGAISESLVNKTNQEIIVDYSVSLQNANGCISSNKVSVIVKPNPTVRLLTEQSVCKDAKTQPIQFSGDLPNTVYNWTNSETGIGLASSGTGDIASFVAKNTGSATLSGYIEVTPELNGCKGATVTVLRINVNPGIGSNFIETNPSAACPGQLVGPLSASYPMGGDGINYVYQWMTSNDGLNYSPLTASGSTSRRFYAPAQTRDTWYKVQVNSGGCIGFTDSVKIKMGVKPVIAVSNRDNYTISIGNATQVFASGATNYQWTPRTYVSDPFIADPFLNPVTDNTKYIVTGTNEDGCSDTASVVIRVVQGYSITPNNVLTPNGDGYNDTWEIKNLRFYKNTDVIIYNRNGVKVKTLGDYQGGWNGTSDAGAKLSTDVYYYIIKLKTATGEVVVKGYINIFN